jgi:hypothetical protein
MALFALLVVLQTAPLYPRLVQDAARYHRACDRLHDVTFQEPEIEDIIRRIYEEGLLLQEVP